MRPRPRWADADVLLAGLIVLVLAIALVVPSLLSRSGDGGSGGGTPNAQPPGGPTLPVPSQTTSATPSAGPTKPAQTGGPGPTKPARPTSSASCVAVPASRISAVSFNMHSGFNRNRSTVALAAVARELRSFNADVYLLQEVDRNRRWSGRTDQPAYLADRLGYYYAFATNVLRSGNSRYGTAILSRYPVTVAKNTLLPRRAGTQQRGLLHVRIAPFNIPVSVYVTHLENTSAPARLAQARSISRIVAADPLPTIVGGDLNSTPGSAVLSTLRSRLSDAWSAGSGAGWTHPAWGPRMRIDYLLYARGLTPVVSQVLPSAVSDHDAVRTVFELPSTPVCLPVVGSGG